MWQERLGTSSDFVAALLGMFVGIGVLVLLGSLIAAGEAGIDYQLNAIDIDGNLTEVEVVGSIVALVTLMASFFTGGWAAGRLSLDDEPLNGAGAGVFFVLLVTIFGVLGAWVGAEYNDADDLTLKAAAAAAGGIVAVVFGGYLGGLVARWHRRTSTDG
jgi:putative membrane protein (TIGR04086 family)